MKHWKKNRKRVWCDSMEVLFRSLRDGIANGKGILRQMLYPARCPVCDRPVKPAGGNICYECHKKIRIIQEPRCMKCGKELKEQSQELCRDCMTKTHRYVRGAALFEYDCIQESLYRFKYEGREEYTGFYSQEMVRYLGDMIREIEPDALVPVPIHPERMQKRGYNQAKLLADGIGKRMGIPVRDQIVVRCRNTIPQKNLAPNERQNNLKRAFKIYENDVKLKTIIIVDDIYTTGSTIDALCEVLEKSGVERIYFVTLAIGKGV